jgi:DNA-binding NtrC family response regulator
MKHILVVDDEIGTRESLKAIFAGAYTVALAENAAAAMKALAEKPADVALLDVMMPDRSGLLLLQDIRALYPNLPVVMISALTSLRPVVESMRVGAYDYVSKPFDVEEILHIVRRAMTNSVRDRRVETLESEVEREFPVREIVGNSPSFRRALDDLCKAAASDATVLIQGESGTGKELAARLLHSQSHRRDEPFVAVHCAALPENLMESELFGFEKGAFTGAVASKPGKFEQADTGTVFLDEIGDVPASTQVKLLRVLQERELERLGSNKTRRIDVRVLAATNQDLRAALEQGTFREDLFYRLNVVPMNIPPLRERKEDIPLLAEHFVKKLARDSGSLVESISDAAMKKLLSYHWPGNVRELENIIERSLVLCSGTRLDAADIKLDLAPRSRTPVAEGFLPEGMTLDEYEQALIREALHRADGNKSHAARLLGLTRNALRYRLSQMGLDG